MAEQRVGSGPEEMWAREREEEERERCSTSESDWGTILVTGEDSMKTVSKQVLGGRKFLMMAVADMSGEREDMVENMVALVHFLSYIITAYFVHLKMPDKLNRQK